MYLLMNSRNVMPVIINFDNFDALEIYEGNKEDYRLAVRRFALPKNDNITPEDIIDLSITIGRYATIKKLKNFY